MNDQTALATVDGEVVEPQAPMTLFGTDDPTAVVERASTVATALGDVLKQRELTKKIGNRDHVLLEGWTLLGSMLGVFAEVEWTRPTETGWEARAVARTLRGQIVGAAESMCSKRERTWSNRDDYAVRSMAQTRAVSKALRLPLGFIVELAGYAATPADELDGGNDEPGDGEREPTRRSAASPATTRRRVSGAARRDSDSDPGSAESAAPPPDNYRREELAQLLHDKGLDFKALETYAAMVGIKSGERATHEQMDQLIETIQQHRNELPDGEQEESADTPSAEGSPDSPPAELPRPDTDEYRALPSGTERAAARAYWEQRKDDEQVSLAAALGAPESDR